jgi:hypothetical protein
MMKSFLLRDLYVRGNTYWAPFHFVNIFTSLVLNIFLIIMQCVHKIQIQLNYFIHWKHAQTTPQNYNIKSINNATIKYKFRFI